MRLLLAASFLFLSLPLISHESSVKISVDGNDRIVRANGIPGHKTGRFPNAHNPSKISEQKFEFHMPLRPGFSGRITPCEFQYWGVALNGVPFDPGTNEFWRDKRNSSWRYEAMGGSMNLGLDANHAHVQPDGSYHYHGIPTALVAGKKGMTLVGFAADGFPVYNELAYKDPDDSKSPIVEMQPGYRLKKGERPDGPGGKYNGEFTADYEYSEKVGDLDECNGRQGVTPEYPQGTYYYVLTERFPNVPRCWKGEPDDTFIKKAPPMRKPGPGDKKPKGPKKPVKPDEIF